MSYSSERLCNATSRIVRNKLAKLHFRIGQASSPNRLYGMKDRLLRGFPEISILSGNRFKAAFTTDHFNEAVTRDAYFGKVRIDKLDSATQALRKGNAATAWMLTTSYYTAFFSALEILRCTGTYVTYFEEQDIYKIQQSSTHGSGRLEAGTYLASARYNDIDQSVLVEFSKTAMRHHQFVWTSISSLIFQAIKDAKLESSHLADSLAEILDGDSKRTPSDTRNLWNYTDATLFSKRGDELGAQFFKLLSNAYAPFDYFSTRKNLSDERQQASSIALCSAVLRQSFEVLTTYVLPKSFL